MIAYIVRRLLLLLPMLVLASMLIFLLVWLVPGDPFSGEVDPTLSAERVEALRMAAGLNDPVHVQYVNWLSKFIRGDMGHTLTSGLPVGTLIYERLINTLLLAGFSLFFTLLVAIPCAIYAARQPYSSLDYTASTLSFFGLATPNFFAGMIAIYFLSMKLPLFPAQGSVSVNPVYGEWLSRLHHVILPALVLGLASTAIYMRYLRSELIEAGAQDYIRTARAKGLSEGRIWYKHTLRNAMIPMMTLLGYELGFLFSGAVIIEAVFGYPGIGQLFLEAIMSKEYPLILAINMLLAMMILLGNLAADIGYSVVDPRIRFR